MTGIREKSDDFNDKEPAASQPVDPGIGEAMRGVIQIFLNTGGSFRWVVLGCVLLGTVADGIGIASMLPLITVAVGGETGD